MRGCEAPDHGKGAWAEGTLSRERTVLEEREGRVGRREDRRRGPGSSLQGENLVPPQFQKFPYLLLGPWRLQRLLSVELTTDH